MVSIHGPATYEVASPEQDAIMSILNSLQIEGIDAIIDKNEDLKCVLEASGMESILHDDWIFPYDKLPALRCVWIPKENDSFGTLEVQVLCEKDAIIVERFSAIGSPEHGYKEAFSYFMRNFLDVLLAAFWNKYPERIQKKIWKINGWNYEAFIGHITFRSSNREDGFVPDGLFSKIEKAIQREKLTKPLHWIKVSACQHAGKHAFEASLDNRVWKPVKSALKSLIWKKMDDYYDLKNLIILKQIDPNKWWQRIQFPRLFSAFIAANRDAG
jgi:hypothetical protein